MKIALSSSAVSQLETECLIVPVIDNGDKEAAPALLAADPAVKSLAEPLFKSGDISGKFLEQLFLYAPAGLKAKRLLFIGGGKAKNFTTVELRKLAGAAVRALKPKNIKSAAILAPDTWEGEASAEAHSTYAYKRGTYADAVRSMVEGAITGDFDVDTYRSDRKDQQVTDLIIVPSSKQNAKAVEAAVSEGTIIAESQNFTRTLGLEPSNLMTPTILADRAKKMCEEVGLQCEVHGPDKIRELKMGAFLSVAQGSEEEPRLIIMRYEPEGAPKDKVLGLVGKGITFDSGGISIKPADNMDKMKYDMAGGATMIGAMRAIALLKPKVRVIAIVCATENMPDGKAQKPGDVQFARNGKTIEVLNTDAEGRMVLADGLCYARDLGATHLVNACTLTGAVVVALGHINSGIFSNDEKFYEQFAQALQRSGEKMWRMPVDVEYYDMIRSDIADIKNTGGRWGGAITAAMFLKEFVDDKPWIHLDIAGTAWLEETKAWMPKGPTGVAVRSLVELARTFNN